MTANGFSHGDLAEEFQPNPYDPRSGIDEPADQQVTVRVSQTMKNILDALKTQTGDSQAKIVREALQDWTLKLFEGNPEEFESSHLNYLARRRKQRDEIVRTRRDTFRRRVDDVIQNRIKWDTEPELVADRVDEFRAELRGMYEGDLISRETYDKRLKYLRKQFADYTEAQEDSPMSRENRSAAKSMSGPKYKEEFEEELGAAIYNVIDAASGISSRVNSPKMNRGRNYARKAANMGVCPADRTIGDVWKEAKERAVEAEETFCDEQPLLQTAADQIENGNERRAYATCEKAAEIYPNEHDLDADDMMERAEHWANAPEAADSRDENGGGGEQPDDTSDSDSRTDAEPQTPQTPGGAENAPPAAYANASDGGRPDTGADTDPVGDALTRASGDLSDSTDADATGEVASPAHEGGLNDPNGDHDEQQPE